jgi:hypothetical protein
MTVYHQLLLKQIRACIDCVPLAAAALLLSRPRRPEVFLLLRCLQACCWLHHTTVALGPVPMGRHWEPSAGATCSVPPLCK